MVPLARAAANHRRADGTRRAAATAAEATDAREQAHPWEHQAEASVRPHRWLFREDHAS